MYRLVLKELVFAVTVPFFFFLPAQFIFKLAVLARKATVHNVADAHVQLFLGNKLHDNLDEWLKLPVFAENFNEVAYFLMLLGETTDVFERFDKINWFDQRPFFTNWISGFFSRWHRGSLDLVARLHKMPWSEGAVNRELFSAVITMLEHRLYVEFEEHYYRLRRRRYEPMEKVNLYIPHFFHDLDVVKALDVQLELSDIDKMIYEFNAGGPNFEGFDEYPPDRAVLQDISLFYALRHLTLHTYHGGEGHLVPLLCKKTFSTQARLRQSLPTPSAALSRELAKAGIEDLSEVKLLSPDWSALIGHNGHLNVHLMMRQMNWWRGPPVMLAYKDRIANRPFLDLFSDICPTLILNDNVDSNVWAELASLTPFLGVSHQIFEFDDGQAMYWNDAGGLAVETWDAQDLGFPLRDIYDARARINPRVDETFDALKKRWGLKPSDWFVCLHMRDAATRGDKDGAGESIRNTSFKNYESAICYITGLGGWVIRMGGSKVTPLPQMERVVDYARDPGQSAEMDIHLVRHASMFIGTTSGFAYVASSFGIPTAMVNAISSVGLLWSKDTRFSLKLVHTRDGRMLTQREVTSEKWRWSFPTFETIAQAGLEVTESSEDEILETVKEVLQLTGVDKYHLPLLDATEIAGWKTQVEVPGFYGSSLPGTYFVEKYRQSFLGQH
jgi:putative glycosyltransferase (TIGR04372 family)